MDDYISREAAIKALEKLNSSRLTMEIFKAIEKVPAADVAPVRHCRWEGYTNSRYFGCDQDGEPIYRDGVLWYCSNPKCRRRTVVKEKFCPSCGAKMDLEDEK